MEVFINELSIQEQYNNIEEFSAAVIVFTKIVSKLNEAKCKKTFFKKGDFYWYKKAIRNEDFRSSINKIKDKFISTSFKRIVFDRNNPKNWLDERVHSTIDNFISETLNCKVTGQSLAEISERRTQNSEKKYILLNFINSSFRNATNTKITKNEAISNSIDCVDSIENIKLWVEKNCIETPIVENTDRFEKTTKLVKGAPVYKELLTGYYWYLDTLHKSHYEVFNSQKEHLGEADLDGNLDTSKQDKSKNGNIDI